MKVRLLALSLAAWVAFYGWVYIVSMRDQGNAPYWWYLAIIGAGAVPPLLRAAGLRSRSLLICDAVILGVTAVLALPSQGMLLLPGVVAASVIAVLSPRRATAVQGGISGAHGGQLTRCSEGRIRKSVNLLHYGSVPASGFRE